MNSNDDKCDKMCLKLFFYVVSTFILYKITQISITYFYINDLELNNHIDEFYNITNYDKIAYIGSSFEYMLIDILLMLIYLSFLFLSVFYLKIYKPLSLFGFIGCMLFWVSFISLLFINNLIHNTNIRCSDCDATDLNNKNLNTMHYLLLITMLVSVFIVCITSIIESHSIINTFINISWYLLYPYLFITCFLYCCYTQDGSQIDVNFNVNDKQNYTNMI